MLTSPQTVLSVAHARKEMVKLALTGEGKVSSSTKGGIDGAKRKAFRGWEERIEMSNEHKLKLTRLGWIRSYLKRLNLLNEMKQFIPYDKPFQE